MANIKISDLQSLEAALTSGVSLNPSTDSVRDLTEEELKIRGGSKGEGKYGEYEEYEKKPEYEYEKKPYPYYFGSN